MSNHNYSQHSNKKNEVENKPEVKPVETKVDPVAPVVKPVETKPEVKMVVEPRETAAVKPEPVAEPVKPKTVKGIVTGCVKLNVRVKPSTSAEVVTIINDASEIEIDMDKSNKDWFYVGTASGAEGYCMRKFISTKL